LFEWCGRIVTQKSHDETASEEQAKRKEEEEEEKKNAKVREYHLQCQRM